MTNASIDLHLAELAASLAEGEEAKVSVCPFCNGGSSKDRSFSARRVKGRLIYICHRVSCAVSGVFNAGNSRQAKAARHRQRVFVTNPDPLPVSTANLLKAKYFFTDEEINRNEIGITCHYSPEGSSRVYLALRRFDGSVRGYVVRDVEGGQTPKAMTFRFHEQDTNLAWFLRNSKLPLVVVEDYFSAMRASSYVNAVSLQGTHINRDVVDELRRSALGPVYLSLDKDATKKAILYSLEFNHVLPLKVVPLSRDLKNMERADLEQFVATHYR